MERRGFLEKIDRIFADYVLSQSGEMPVLESVENAPSPFVEQREKAEQVSLPDSVQEVSAVPCSDAKEEAEASVQEAVYLLLRVCRDIAHLRAYASLRADTAQRELCGCAEASCRQLLCKIADVRVPCYDGRADGRDGERQILLRTRKGIARLLFLSVCREHTLTLLRIAAAVG